MALGKPFTHFTRLHYLVLAIGWCSEARKVTSGMAESYGSLPHCLETWIWPRCSFVCMGLPLSLLAQQTNIFTFSLWSSQWKRWPLGNFCFTSFAFPHICWELDCWGYIHLMSVWQLRVIRSTPPLQVLRFSFITNWSMIIKIRISWLLSTGYVIPNLVPAMCLCAWKGIFAWLCISYLLRSFSEMVKLCGNSGMQFCRFTT